MLDIENLGQVFTTSIIIEEMLSLIKNKGTILEPSCGAGAFFNNIPDCIGIEYDKKVCPKTAFNIDFFDYPLSNQFDTIIGNPPYVKYKNIAQNTKNKLNISSFDERSNLYLFFIEKSIQHLKDNGELIFIVPRDFIKASSAVKLNKFIYSQGTITHWKDLGDKIIFPGFSPNCVIFRFEKNNFSRITKKTTTKENLVCNFIEMNGQLIFTEKNYFINLTELFVVKVGAVSGADQYFSHALGNKDFIYSKTNENGFTKKMFYNIEAPELLPYKDILLKRKIKNFTDKNWYTWGRGYCQKDIPRIYVNNKTRKKNPFFTHSCQAYDGSVLALFPKFKVNTEQLETLCLEMNAVNWDELGFICGGRFLFNQRSLEQSFLPENFSKYKIIDKIKF